MKIIIDCDVFLMIFSKQRGIIMNEKDRQQLELCKKDVQQIKEIYDDYLRNELKVEDQEEIDKRFEAHLGLALEIHTVKAYIEYLKDASDNINADYVITDIKYDLNYRKEFNMNHYETS
jgi:hypothetical protein